LRFWHRSGPVDFWHTPAPRLLARRKTLFCTLSCPLDATLPGISWGPFHPTWRIIPVAFLPSLKVTVTSSFSPNSTDPRDLRATDDRAFPIRNRNRGIYVPVAAEEEIHRLACFVNRARRLAMLRVLQWVATIRVGSNHLIANVVMWGIDGQKISETTSTSSFARERTRETVRARPEDTGTD
jgi:hypothetical protein